MVKENIMLSSIEAVKKFVSITTKYDFQINLTTDKYKIDAKSIMGVFSLDLSKPITLKAGDLVTIQEGPAKGTYHVAVCHVLDAWKNEYEIVWRGHV